MSSSGAVAWIPPLVTLAIGLVAGALVFLLARRSRRAPALAVDPRPLHARDLLAKRDALVRQLQELEDTGSKRTPAQLARERYDLELEAAQVLLALDAEGEAAQRVVAREAVPEVGSAPRPGSDSRAGIRGFFWGVGSATALLLLVFFVWRSANPRDAGGSVTGGSQAARGAPADPTDADEAQITAAIERNPSDVSAHLALAQLKLVRRDLMGVWNEATRVLELAPGNARALTYQGVVRLAMGQSAVAVDLLRKAMAADPDLIDAHAYLALAYARMGRRQEAEQTVAAAARRFPDRADEFRGLLGEVEAGQPEQSQPAPAPARSGRRHVAGTILLDPPLAGAVRPGAVLFVFVRAAGATEGPPVAVKRLAPVFPVSFDLSDEDAMMGQPFPDPLLIEARLDEDGDPTTRPPTDPKARLDGIRAGRTDLRLVLKRP